jgi:hypothetical protein
LARPQLSIYALPAWVFLDRGFDAWFGNTRLRRVDPVISLTLLGIFLTLGIGLRFGLSDVERQGQELLTWYIGGVLLLGISDGYTSTRVDAKTT